MRTLTSATLYIFLAIVYSCPVCFTSSVYLCMYPILCSLLVRGCDFQFDGNQISLGSSLKKAIITGNIITVSLN